MFREQRSSQAEWTVYRADMAPLSVTAVPAAGANVCSLEFAGREYLRQAPSLAELPGFRFGVPVLYPTPGRVAGGGFNWDGVPCKFPETGDLGALHGLVHSEPWDVSGTAHNAHSASLMMHLDIAPGSGLYQAFPFQHRLGLRIDVWRDRVRWTYAVQNRESQRAVPFGCGLHPWFVGGGRRAEVWLSVPAPERLVLDQGHATGTIEPIVGTDRDLRAGTELQDRTFDDVYRIAPGGTTAICFPGSKPELTLRGSSEFRYVVVYVPAEEDSFCVEPWTCPPNAHQLYLRGQQHAADLQCVSPGQTQIGWFEIEFG